MSYGTIALIAVAILLLTPLSRILLAALFGRSIGQAALARQPDTIHLKPIEGARLRHAGRVQTLAEPSGGSRRRDQAVQVFDSRE